MRSRCEQKRLPDACAEADENSLSMMHIRRVDVKSTRRGSETICFERTGKANEAIGAAQFRSGSKTLDKCLPKRAEFNASFEGESAGSQPNRFEGVRRRSVKWQHSYRLGGETKQVERLGTNPNRLLQEPIA